MQRRYRERTIEEEKDLLTDGVNTGVTVEEDGAVGDAELFTSPESGGWGLGFVVAFDLCLLVTLTKCSFAAKSTKASTSEEPSRTSRRT